MNDLERMPNKCLQTVSKEYFEFNKARERAEKERQKQQQQEQQQNKAGNRNTGNNKNPKNDDDGDDDYALYDTSAQDLQDVMEDLMEGDI